ncbi:MAG: hypothetical protein HGB26_07905 [Desulfobulbaceae bacterium]|nr:hypothetical protein [Desulfobulbaceae bacterium]
MFKKIYQILVSTSNGPFFKDYGADDQYWEFPSLFGTTKHELDKIIINLQEPITDKETQSIILSCISNLLHYPHNKVNEIEKWVGMTNKELEQFNIKLRKSGWDIV